MATRNVPDDAKGATLPMVMETGTWGVIATGTAAQIVEAGLCAPVQFPQGRKRSGYLELPDGGSLSFERRKGGVWSVRLRWPNERRKQLEEQQRQREAKQKRLDGICRDGETWRAKEVNKLCSLMELHASFTASACGWHFSEKSMREVESLISRVRMVLLNAEVRLDEQKRATYLAENAVDSAVGHVPMHRSAHLRVVHSGRAAHGLQS